MLPPPSQPVDSGAPLAEVWHRQPGEPAKWFDRFSLYLQLGPGRSLWAAYQQARQRSGAESAGKRGQGMPRSWRLAAERYQWQLRAEAYDTSKQQEELEEWERRRAELRKQQWDTSQAMLNKAQQMMVFPLQKTVRHDEGAVTEIYPTRWTMGDAARLARAGQDLGTAAVGETKPDESGGLPGGLDADEMAAAAREVGDWEQATYPADADDPPNGHGPEGAGTSTEVTD